MKNQLFRLILSENLKNILKNINDSISKKLLFFNDNNDFGYPMSYIDIADEDTITYTSSKKVIELIHKLDNRSIWDVGRNYHRIGRFVSKVTGEDSQQIESFVNRYKSEIKSLNNLDNFDIVSGEKVSNFYSGKFYSKGGGSLNKSCMRHDRCQDYFNFYNINPDVVKLVILYENDKKDKILGRALLWNINNPKKISLLDRIYTANDSDKNLFTKLAIKNKWHYKSSQKFDERYFINLDGKSVEINCKIFLKNEKYINFPYLDTFHFYNKKECYITNNKNEFYNNKNIVKLRATDGRDQGNENFVYDSYNNDTVKVDETIYCEFDDSKILTHDVIVYCHQYGKTYFRPDNIRYSEYDNKIYPQNRAIWSTTHKTFIEKSKSFRVYFDEFKNEYDYLHSNLNGKEFNYVNNKNSYFVNSLLIKIDDQFYLKCEHEKSKMKPYKAAIDFNNFFDELVHDISKKNGVYYNSTNKVRDGRLNEDGW